MIDRVIAMLIFGVCLAMAVTCYLGAAAALAFGIFVRHDWYPFGAAIMAVLLGSAMLADALIVVANERDRPR